MDFTNSYHRWFEGLYRDKYDYFGDSEIMRIAFLLDLGLYYLGVASQPFKHGAAAFQQSPFSQRVAVPFYRFMQFYTRRLAAMARMRRTRGTFGRRNAGEWLMFGGYIFVPSSAWHVAKATVQWGWLEITEGWRSWFARREELRPAMKPAMAEAPSRRAFRGRGAAASSPAEKSRGDSTPKDCSKRPETLTPNPGGEMPAATVAPAHFLIRSEAGPG